MIKYINVGFLYLISGIVAFGFFLYTGFTKEKITSSEELIEIEGSYSKHSFKDNKGFKNFTQEYYIWTDNYKNAFQIKADYLGIFNKKYFAANVKQGAKVRFTVPNRLAKSLNSDQNIVLTSIIVEEDTYLDLEEVLEVEKRLATSNADYYFGIGFLLAGLFRYFKEK